MIPPEQLADYLDDALEPAQRDAVERELEKDAESLHYVIEQRRIERVLQSVLGAVSRKEQLKASVRAAIRGQTVEQLRHQVLSDTSGLGVTTVGTESVPLATRKEPAYRLWWAELLRRWPLSGCFSLLAQRRKGRRGCAFRIPLSALSRWSPRSLILPGARYAAAAVVVLLAILTGWIVLSQRSVGGARIGTLAQSVGFPVLQRSGLSDTETALTGAPVKLGDRLETGDADRAEIRFNDGTTLSLGHNTAVEMPHFAQPDRDGRIALTRPSEVRLLHGQIWTQVQKSSPAAEYAIRTEAAMAVARGTEFGVKVRRVADSDTKSDIINQKSEFPLLAVLTVKEGTVDFFNAFGTVQATAMTESTARAGSAPTEPKRLEALQVVHRDDSTTWSLLTSALDWPEAAEKLAGGGGLVGWQLREVRRADGVVDVRVSHLPASSPAARAGVQTGDMLIEFDGQPVAAARAIAGAILRRPNETIPLRLRRGDRELAVSLLIESIGSLVRGPELGAESRAPLAALLAKWTCRQTGQAVSPAGEMRRSEEIARFSRAGELRAAACNQLGVAYELEDALGPAIRAYGRAVYLAPQVPLYHFNLGLALRKIGSFERALEECQTAARLEPDSIPARKRVAEIHSLLGRHTEALALTEALLEAAPQDHGTWELKSQLLLKLNRPVDSVAPARRAVELDPDCPVAHAYLAEALHAAGQLDDAESAYAEILERAPFEPVFYMNHGILLRDRGQAAAAERSFRQAIGLRPDFALAYHNLGNVLADRRDYAAATAAFNKAIELDPTEVTARLRLGDMALKRRQFAQAERAYRQALEIAPHNADAYNGLGEASRLQRRPADAERAYRRAIEMRPDYAAAHTALGIVCYDRGELDEAERLYRRAIELDPREAAPYHNLGNLFREARGDLDAAERWFRQALEHAPDDGESLGGLALVAKGQGNPAEAERLLRRAIKQAPDSSALHNNLGEVLRERGRPDEAEPFYIKALELDPDNPAPYGNLGILQAERKQFADAEKTFRALLDRSAGNARLPTLVNLATVCGEQGKLDEAERLFRQALELAPNHPRVGNSFASFLADHKLKLDEALTLATRSVQSAPNDPNFLDTLGWVHAQRGELDAAERTLQRALDLAGQEPPAKEIRKHLDQARERKGAVQQ